MAPLLSSSIPPVPDVEDLLARAARTSDPHRRAELRDQVVIASLDLADRSARRYTGRGIDSEDLVQVARLALVKAVRGYRCGLGHSFAGYAVPTISGEIKRHFRDCGWDVRPPRRLQEARARMLRQEEQLWHDLGRQPSVDEIAEATGDTTTSLLEAKACTGAYNAVSIDAPTGATGESTEIADPGDAYVALEQHEALAEALRELTPREQRIVQLRFVDELTQSEIGAALGVSQMQISRLLGGILAKLRVVLVQAEAA
jgi:RNA polymerase sigma-B factor